MSEQNEAQWHDEPTDYGQIGKLPPRTEAASAQDTAPPASVIGSLNITAAAADPELLDLPWHIAWKTGPPKTWPRSPAVSPGTSSASRTWVAR